MVNIDATLDARGLDCPMPFSRTKIELNALKSGEILKVLTNKCEVTRYFPILCEKKGHELLDSFSANGEYTYYIKKA